MTSHRPSTIISSVYFKSTLLFLLHHAVVRLVQGFQKPQAILSNENNFPAPAARDVNTKTSLLIIFDRPIARGSGDAYAQVSPIDRIFCDDEDNMVVSDNMLVIHRDENSLLQVGTQYDVTVGAGCV